MPATQPLLLPDFAPARNGKANRVLLTDQAAHQWYRFVLSYPPHIVRDYLDRFGCKPGSTVLDPFTGTGTTVVEAQKLGMRGLGVEALPMAHFAAKTKLNWDIDSAGLLQTAERIAEQTLRQLRRSGLTDSGIEESPNDLQLSTFPPEAQKLLLTNCVSPLPLHKLLVLSEKLHAAPVSPYTDHLRLALAKAAVSSISNLHFGPEVGVRTLKRDVPVVEAWLNEVRVIANDLSSLALHEPQRRSLVLNNDSRQSLEFQLQGRVVDAVITSPPYPNEKDYTRTTRLETVLLGFAKDRKELQALKRSLVRSNTRSVYKADDDDMWIRRFPQIQEIAQEIERRRIEMNKTSGFERQYARVTKLYFGGMARHLESLKKVLRPNAHLAYVVGDQASYLRVMIRTGSILGEIAESLGYKVESIDLFRTRISTTTKEQLREEVVVLRAPEK